MIGIVREVRDERLGGEVTLGAAALATEIVLDDVTDFQEDGGDLLLPGGSTQAYTAVDFDTLTITVVSLVEEINIGDWVAPWSSTHEDLRRIAEVDIDAEEPVIAIIPHSLRSLFKPGTRKPGEAETVAIEVRGIEVFITDVRSKLPGVVGPTLDIPLPDEPGFHVATDGAISISSDVGTTFRVNSGGNVEASRIDLPDSSSESIIIDGAFGEIRLMDVRVYDDVADTFPVVRITEPGLQFGPGGGTAPDAALYRSDTNELTFDDASTGYIQVRWGGGAGNGFSRLAMNDYLELAERNSDPGAGPTGSVRIYSKIVSGTSKLFAQDDAGGVHGLW